MELTVDRDEFLDSVSLVQAVVDRRNTMPVLTNLYLEANDTELCLRSMDLQVAMEVRCPARVAAPGKTTVSAKRLFSILRELPALPVSFRADQDDWINLSCGNADFKLVGIPAERYPAFPEMSPTGGRQQQWKLGAATLLGMLKKTVFVASKEEGRAAFSGLYWVLHNGKLELVATDGHRLARVSRPMEPLKLEQKETLLLPRRAMAELERILEAHKDIETVDMLQNGQQVIFRTGPVVLSCSVLEGRFPNYEMVIPKDNDKVVRLTREGLRQAIRRTSLLADDQFHGIQLDLTKDKLLLTSRNKDLGHAREDIAVDYQGAELEVIFNSGYVLEFLQSLEADEIELSFKTSTSATLVKDIGDDDYQCILMPMKV
jgi:DNA polymerase III subunit beta